MKPPAHTRQILLAVSHVGALMLVLTIGVWVGHHRRWPFEVIRHVYILLHMRPSVAAVPPHLRLVDLDRSFTIHSREDISTRRRQLTEVIWGDAAMPLVQQPTVEAGVIDERWQDTPGIARIDRLTITLNGGVRSFAYHFVPQGTPRPTLLIFQEGHGGGFIRSRLTIAYFVRHGYSVIALAMPLLGRNERPVVYAQGGEGYRIESHDQMGLLDRPLQYFVEPPVVAVNYALQQRGVAQVGMIGFSGGGWVATLAAAVDERIRFVFPVASSLPPSLRAPSRDRGDFEYSYPPLLRVVSYLDLYLLGALGEGRRQLMIYNDEDPCCFAGSRAQLFLPPVARRLASLGAGHFDLWVDRNDEHSVSPAALDRIRAALEHPGAD